MGSPTAVGRKARAILGRFSLDARRRPRYRPRRN